MDDKCEMINDRNLWHERNLLRLYGAGGPIINTVAFRRAALFVHALNLFWREGRPPATHTQFCPEAHGMPLTFPYSAYEEKSLNGN